MLALSFLSPGRLALLVVPLALVAAYLVAQRRRQRYALRFTNLDLLDAVAPDRPGWRRHLPAFGLLAGLTLAALAFARPATASERAVEGSVVVLALDTSASMEAEDVQPSRLEAAKEAAQAFVDQVPDDLKIGLVGFDSTARVLLSPTDNHEAARRMIDRLELGEGTAIGDAVYASLDATAEATLDGAEGDVGSNGQPGATIVLLSDGETTAGRPNEEAAAEAARLGVPVNTIAFGTPDGSITVETGETVKVPVNHEALRTLASSTRGEYFPAATASELTSVYEELGKSVSAEPVTKEITDWVAAAALVMVALAGAGSLLWFSRLP